MKSRPIRPGQTDKTSRRGFQLNSVIELIVDSPEKEIHLRAPDIIRMRCDDEKGGNVSQYVTPGLQIQSLELMASHRDQCWDLHTDENHKHDLRAFIHSWRDGESAGEAASPSSSWMMKV